MNRKGLTLVELLATLVALSLVLGLGTYSITNVVRHTKNKAELAFADSIRDAMDIYISGPDKTSLPWGSVYNTCEYTRDIKDADGKIIGTQNVTVEYEVLTIKLSDVINSRYKPISAGDLVNPVTNKSCVPAVGASSVNITLYRTSNSIYYYKIWKRDLNDCFNLDNAINLDTGDTTNKLNYISNLEEPGRLSCH